MEHGAARLRALDLAAGDRALLYMEACAAWPAAFFSILEAGLVVVPIPADTPVATAAHVAAFADARLAIVGKRTGALLASSGVRVLPVDQLFEAETNRHTADADALPELALLAFTSGCTSQPRAVELTHANLLANLHALLRVRRAAPGDAFLSMLPPAHLFELMVGMLGPLACGARIVYASSLLPHRLLAALRDERITHALSVPALLDVLYQELIADLVEAGVLDRTRRDQTLAETARTLRQDTDAAELDRLRTSIHERIGTSLHTLVVGGAALDPAWAEITAALGLRLEVGYGLTEAAPIVSVGLASESPAGSAGRPLPGIEVQVSPEREILVRGANVMRGYLGDAHATALALADGWLHTGDHGYVDAQGFLFVTGRLKEVLVTAAGQTLYPEEVEPHYDSPLFAERCVAGMPGPHGNDVPVLFVVPASPELGEQELRRAFEDLRAAAPPRLRVADMVRLTAPLPRTALGKVRRRSLAQNLQNREAP
jgi:long-chain acyl-CoA synthetase